MRWRVTKTPFFASSCDPSAIVTVNIVGRATGIADTNKINAKDNITNKFMPRIHDTAKAIASKVN